MKHLKILGLAVVAAAALTAFIGAGTASATVLCNTNTTPCGSKVGVGAHVTANLTPSTQAVLKAGFATIKCNTSTVTGEITNAGSATTTVEGPITSLTFTNCGTADVTVAKPGKLVAHWISGTMNANVTAEGFTVEIEETALHEHCNYAGNITSGLTLTASNNAVPPSTAELDAVNASVPLEAGSGPFCASPATWNATYTITAPDPLYVAES